MTVVAQYEPRYGAKRIAVESVLLYRLEGMRGFELCSVVSVSTSGLEILLPQQLPYRTVLNMAVRDEASRRQFYRVIGEVNGGEREDREWVYWVTALPKRPWSSKVLYDIVCATPDVAPTLAEKYRVSRGAGLDDEYRCQSDAVSDVGWNVVQFPSRQWGDEFSLY